MEPAKRILIVEDEISLLNVLFDKFTIEGYTVLKSLDGKDGLNIALSEQPDLILLDINMPVMDGITMLKELRKDERGKNVEVVMLTNYSDYKLLESAMEQGSHDYLIKSDWKLDDVVELVNNKLK